MNQLLIGGFLFILIWGNVNNIFQIMPHGEIYQKGKYVIFLIGISKVFDAATGINAAILSYSKYYYYLLIFIFLLFFRLSKSLIALLRIGINLNLQLDSQL